MPNKIPRLDDDSERFRRNLMAFMEKNNLTSADIADLTGYSLATIRTWTSGKCCPDEKKITEIEKQLKLTKGSLSKRSALARYVFNDIPPVVEDVYPISLLNYILNNMDYLDRSMTEEEKFDRNVWDYNIRSFKNLINKILTEREQQILQMRFRDGFTLEECANNLNLTRQRVQQVENKALARLKIRMSASDKPCSIISNEEYDKVVNELIKVKLELTEAKQLLKLSPSMVDDETLNMRIEELDLSVRSYHALNREGLTRLSHLIEYDGNVEKKPWSDIRNLGIKSMNEIYEKVAQKGYILPNLRKDIEERKRG